MSEPTIVVPATPAKTKLTENFWLEEFAVSASRPELVEPVPQRFVANVRRLAETILQPIRDLWGRSLDISSGYRSKALNEAVGGSESSQHRRAEAADVTTWNVRGLFRAMLIRPNKFPTGQLIYYPKQNFTHVALPGIRYDKPTFFVCMGPKEYRQVRTAEEFDRAVRDALR